MQEGVWRTKGAKGKYSFKILLKNDYYLLTASNGKFTCMQKLILFIENFSSAKVFSENASKLLMDFNGGYFAVH